MPKRRQGVHQSPWPAPSTAQGAQVLPAERRCPTNARAYIRALGKHQVLHGARKRYRQSGGAQTTPERTSEPLASAKYCTGHTIATGRAAVPGHATGRAAVPKRRQNVHQSPWQAPSTAQGTQVLPAERRCPNDASRAAVPKRRQGVHQSPWPEPSTAQGAQVLPAERRCPNDARAYIRALGQHQVLHRARKCYRQSGGAQTTPERTSEPLASAKYCTGHASATGRAAVPKRRQNVHQSPWQAPSTAQGAQVLPAERRRPNDARAYICPAPSTAQGPQVLPAERRQSVHQSPWPAPSTAQGTQTLPAERRCPNDARAYIRALGQHQVLRRARNRQSGARAYIRALGQHQVLHRARKCYRQSGGAQTTPERTSEPLASTKYCTEHASATGRAAVPKRRQSVHQTWQAPSTAQGTQVLPAERRCPNDARAYIRLGKHQVLHRARKCYRQSGGAQTTPERTSEPLASTKYCAGHASATGRAAVPKRRQSVHQSPWPAPSTAQGAQMLPAERRCPNDARAYIRALGQHQVLHRARKCYRQSGGAQPTPERTSEPLASTKYCTGHTSATGRAAVPKRRQSVHQTWQAPSTAQGAQILPAERRCPNDARAYIRALDKRQVLHRARKCYRQSGGAQTTPERTSEPLASTKYCAGVMLCE